MKHLASGHTRRGGGVLVALLHALLTEGTYTTYADLAEDLKGRCARLRIAYDAAAISNAIEAIERGGREPVIHRPVTCPTPIEREPEPIDRATAHRLLTELFK